MMATFEDCVDYARKNFRGILCQDFEGTSYVLFDLPEPICFKARTDNHVVLTEKDTNEEFDKIYKVMNQFVSKAS
jgi:hypothetical protein